MGFCAGWGMRGRGRFPNALARAFVLWKGQMYTRESVCAVLATRPLLPLMDLQLYFLFFYFKQLPILIDCFHRFASYTVGGARSAIPPECACWTNKAGRHRCGGQGYCHRNAPEPCGSWRRVPHCGLWHGVDSGLLVLSALRPHIYIYNVYVCIYIRTCTYMLRPNSSTHSVLTLQSLRGFASCLNFAS